MNLSGGPTQSVLHYYKIPKSNLIVIHDELALPLGKLKFRRGGGSGGHNGITNIIQQVHLHSPHILLSLYLPVIFFWLSLVKNSCDFGLESMLHRLEQIEQITFSDLSNAQNNQHSQKYRVLLLL